MTSSKLTDSSVAAVRKTFIPRPAVTAVVLNWNNAALTSRCIQSLELARYPRLRIIAVDNGSSDGSADELRLRHPDLEIVRLSHNVGFARGMNCGIETALGGDIDWVLLLNNDTAMAVDSLSELVRAGESHAAIGIVVPKILYPDDGLIWAAGARWCSFPPRVKMVGFRRQDGEEYDRPCDLTHATGCCLLVRAETLRLIGGFDPGYFMYFEDYEFCERVRAAGYRIAYVPSARVWHQASASLGEDSAQKWRFLGQASVRFFGRKPLGLGTLMLHVMWVIARETLKGNWRFVPPYLSGLLARPGRQDVE